MTENRSELTEDQLTEEVDPRVAELVVAIRDRFGLRGLRGARWMIDREIARSPRRPSRISLTTEGDSPVALPRMFAVL